MRGFRRLAALLLPLAALVFVDGCDRSDAATVEGYRATESLRDDPSTKSVEELKRDIAGFKREAERTVKASENLGVYYRLLAVAYMNRQMYGEALDSLTEAIRYYPENEQLFFYAGVCAGRMAKAQTDPAEAARLFALSEKYYQRTLFLYADHGPALMGLAVLYAIELNRPAEAVPLLERLLKKDTSNVEAKLLLARVHVSLGEYEQAIALYNEVAKAQVSDAVRQQALENAREVESRLTGSTR